MQTFQGKEVKQVRGIKADSCKGCCFNGNADSIADCAVMSTVFDSGTSPQVCLLVDNMIWKEVEDAKQ